METKELLIALDKRLQEFENEKPIGGYSGISYERVLVYLLHEYEQQITGLIEQDASGAWFHKAFRQTDVVSGKIDSVIWGLIWQTNILWECLSPKDGL